MSNDFKLVKKAGKILLPWIKEKLISKKTTYVLLRISLFSIIAILVGRYANIFAGILLEAIGILYEMGYQITTEQELKISLDNLANKIISPTINIPIDAIVPKNYTYLPEKLTSPIQIFINEKIVEALEDLFKINRKDTGTCYFPPERIQSGIVWIVQDADINTYAIIAKHFDEKVLLDEQGYIWSTNITDPKEFDKSVESGDNVLEHIKIANKKAEKEVETGGQGQKLPALLRLQFVRKQKKEGFLIPDIQSFSSSLLSSTNAKKYYFRTDLFQKNVFILDVSQIEEAGGIEFEKLGYFLGDYIVYSDMAVVKWDEKANVLYLMFGREVVNAYKNVFINFLEEWKKDQNKNLTAEILNTLQEKNQNDNGSTTIS